jgi:thiol-disulfide isomerase/thioredoxin
MQAISCSFVNKSVKKKNEMNKPKVFFREGTESKVGSVAPAIIAPTVKGKVVSTANCDGRVIILNFWSIKCGPCIKELPYLEKLYNEFNKDGLEIFSVNTDKVSVGTVGDFIGNRAFDISYDVLADPDLVLSSVFTKWFVPVTILIDSNGVMRYNNTGFTKRDYEKYRKIIKSIIDEQKRQG